MVAQRLLGCARCQETNRRTFAFLRQSRSGGSGGNVQDISKTTPAPSTQY